MHLWETLPLGRTAIIIFLLTIVATIWFVKIILYRRVSALEIILSLIWFLLVAVFYSSLAWVKNLLTLSYLIIVIYTIYHFNKVKNEVMKGEQQLLNHLKNASTDFFFQTNKNDKIINASISCYNRSGVNKSQFRKLKGQKFLTKYFDILAINQKEVDENLIQNFTKDYLKAKQPFKSYKFTFEILEQGKIQTFLGLIYPLYEGKKYLGKNVYFNQERHEIIKDLQTALNDSMNDFEDAKGQLHLLMSLTDQVALYYDFHSKTYVGSDAYNKFIGTNRIEYSFDEFINLIHPDDLDQYIKQSSTINSISTTRFNYRLLINNAYYQVFEDAIYLGKERGLISLIRLQLDQVGELVVEDDKTNSMIDLDILDQKKPSSLFEQTSSLLDVVVGKKHENE